MMSRASMFWHASATVVLILAPSHAMRGDPMLSLNRATMVQLFGLGLAYLAAVTLRRMLRSDEGDDSLASQLLSAGFPLSAYYLALLLVVPSVSRSFLLFGSVLYVLFFFGPRLLPRSASIATAAIIGAAVLLVGMEGIAWSKAPASSADREERKVIHTVFHTVSATYYRGVLPYEPVWGGIRGGIDDLGSDYLVVAGDGAFFRLSFAGDSLAVDALGLRAPLNRADFLRDAEESGFTVRDVWFHVPGILVQELPDDKLRVFVSHHRWKTEQKCVVLRVSSVTLTSEELLHSAEGTPWETVYETKPCLPLKQRGHPFAGHQAGGRLQLLGDTALILTVGDHEYDGWGSEESLPQGLDNDYGKTLLISLDRGGAEVYSVGHRNPQGLSVSEDGTIWLTEHGPSGGDKLNRLARGGNYGWPVHTYGAAYGSFFWTPPPTAGEVGELREPDYLWMPGIGISNVVSLRSSAFSRWKGDLIVSSLAAQSLYRVRLDHDHAIYAEEIPIGERIRDLVEGADGRIVLWTDDGAIVSVTPAEGEEGEVLFQRCVACHSLDGSPAIGPDLRGVVGRRVASVPGYDYSGALETAGGVWTEERLDGFLRDPASFAPGTAMVVEGIADAEVRQRLIRYMEELGKARG